MMTDPNPCAGSGQTFAALAVDDRRRGPIAAAWYPCPVCRERQPVTGSPPAIATHYKRRDAETLTLAL